MFTVQLAITGGHDAVARVWDLRTGKNVLVLQGHLKPVLAVDTAPNGYTPYPIVIHICSN